MDTGDRLKEARKSLGLSQSQFAARYKIPLATYQGWEQGRHLPPEYVTSLLITLIETEKIIQKGFENRDS